MVIKLLKGKVTKGIAYFREHGFFLTILQTMISISMLTCNGIKYGYYRCLCRGSLLLDHFGLLKRVERAEGIPEVIVSFTSYPARMETIHTAIESLLIQTYKADRVILWLAESQFPGKEADLSPKVRKLTSKGLEIRWCEDIRSYKKMIPAQRLFPDAIIITVDDDTMCNRHLVERLIEGYLAYPNCIQCHAAYAMEMHDVEGIKMVKPIINGYLYPFPTYLYELLGYAGCLYPPHCFYKDVSDEKLFMQLAPGNDDVWFWLMGALNGFKINVVKNNEPKCRDIPWSQETALRIQNTSDDFKVMYEQLNNVLRHYPELQKRLQEEQKVLDGVKQQHIE